jgi:hypothetical protein
VDGTDATGARNITTYFRSSFEVADVSRVISLALSMVRDDGAVVYLNGSEVFRTNMPSGTPTSTTKASATVAGGDESAFVGTEVSPNRLVTGTNVLAVEMHQVATTSTDISFDFALVGTR